MSLKNNKPRPVASAVSIPEHLFTSAAYRALDPLGRCLLTELLAIAKRVGTDVPITCSARMAADMCAVGKSHGADTIASLEALGFIVCVRRGRPTGRGQGLASEWRITCLPFQGEWPTCDYARIYDRAHNREAFDDRGDEKFLTPELEAQWRRTEARYARGACDPEDGEYVEIIAKLDAEASSGADKKARLRSSTADIKRPLGRTLGKSERKQTIN